MSYHLVDYSFEGNNISYLGILDTSDMEVDVLSSEEFRELNGIPIEGIVWGSDFDIVGIYSQMEAKLRMGYQLCDIKAGVLTSLVVDKGLIPTEGLRGIYVRNMTSDGLVLKLSDNLSFVAYDKWCDIVNLTFDVSDVKRNDLLVMAHRHKRVRVIDNKERSAIIRPIANIFDTKKAFETLLPMSAESDRLFCSLFGEYINKSMRIVVRDGYDLDMHVKSYLTSHDSQRFEAVIGNIFMNRYRDKLFGLLMYILQGGRNSKMVNKYKRLCEACWYPGGHII